MKSTIPRYLIPAAFFSTVLASLFFAATPSEASPHKRVVVVNPRSTARVTVIRTPRVERRVWIPGHWKYVSPHRAVWVRGHRQWH